MNNTSHKRTLIGYTRNLLGIQAKRYVTPYTSLNPNFHQESLSFNQGHLVTKTHSPKSPFIGYTTLSKDKRHWDSIPNLCHLIMARKRLFGLLSSIDQSPMDWQIANQSITLLLRSPASICSVIEWSTDRLTKWVLSALHRVAVHDQLPNSWLRVILHLWLLNDQPMVWQIKLLPL